MYDKTILSSIELLWNGYKNLTSGEWWYEAFNFDKLFSRIFRAIR